VDGAVSNAAFHGMKEDLKAEMDKASTETGDLTITNLEMVSDRAIRLSGNIWSRE
jgi:hypothetical protein